MMKNSHGVEVSLFLMLLVQKGVVQYFDQIESLTGLQDQNPIDEVSDDWGTMRVVGNVFLDDVLVDFEGVLFLERRLLMEELVEENTESPDVD